MISLYRLIRESGVSLGVLAFIFVLACVSSLLAVLPPHFLGASVNAIVGAESGVSAPVFSPIQIFNSGLSWMVAACGLPPLVLFLALFFIINVLFLVIRNFFAVYISLFSNNFVLFVRKKCFAKIIRGEKKDLERFNSGDFVHRVMNDTLQLDYLIGNPLYTLCSDILNLLWISIIILLIDWKILLILLSIIPLLYYLCHRTGKRQRDAEAIQRNETACTGFIQRSVMGLDTIKAYQAEEREAEMFLRLNAENNALRRKSSICLGFFFPQEGALRAVGTIAVISYASFLATKDTAYIGVRYLWSIRCGFMRR